MTDETTETAPAVEAAVPEEWTAPDEPGEQAKMIGQAMTWLGAAALAGSFFLPTSVRGDGYGDVVNLGKQQFQLMVAVGSAAVMIGGILLRGFGTIFAEMAKHRR